MSWEKMGKTLGLVSQIDNIVVSTAAPVNSLPHCNSRRLEPNAQLTHPAALGSKTSRPHSAVPSGLHMVCHIRDTGAVGIGVDTTELLRATRASASWTLNTAVRQSLMSMTLINSRKNGTFRSHCQFLSAVQGLKF